MAAECNLVRKDAQGLCRALYPRSRLADDLQLRGKLLDAG